MITLVIYGTTGLTSTADTGAFYCPNCGGQQHYEMRQVRRFFTLYFIPLIPLDVIGRFVRCGGCGSEYQESVLHFDPQAQQQAFFDDLKRVMILMAIADGGIDPTEIAVIQQNYQDLSGNAISEAEISQEAQLAISAGATVSGYAGQIADDLGDEGKAVVVQVAFAVASAGGNLPQGKQAQLQQLPAALGISQDYFKQIISSVSGG